MNAPHPLLAALLLGLAVTAPAWAIEPATDAASASSVSEPAPAADVAVEATDVAVAEAQVETGETNEAAEIAEAVVEAAPAPAAVAPAWEHLVPIDAAMQVSSNGQPVGDKTLRLIQRSTTGKVVAAQVATSLFAGVLGGSSFKKEDLRGSRVKDVPNPAFGYLQDQVRASLATYFTAHPGALPEEETEVRATADMFALVYKELGDAETEYELRQTMHLGFPYRRKLLRLTGGEGVQCGQAQPVSAPLEAWQANDYALAKETAQKYADECVAQFVAVLPTLFPDRAAVAVEATTPEEGA